MDGLYLPDHVIVELRPDESLLSQAPFDRMPPVITQQDLPRIAEFAREQNFEESGPDSDRPD